MEELLGEVSPSCLLSKQVLLTLPKCLLGEVSRRGGCQQKRSPSPYPTNSGPAFPDSKLLLSPQPSLGAPGRSSSCLAEATSSSPRLEQ